MTAGESRDVPASSGALDVAAIQARVDAAFDEVIRLCERDGDNRWRMSIPANPSRDSDLVITASLDDVPALLAALADAQAENERLRAMCIPLADLAQELDLARQNLHHARAMSDAHWTRAEIERERAEAAEATIQAVRDLADQWKRRAREMGFVAGESPRPADYSEGHYSGGMKTYRDLADGVLRVLDGAGPDTQDGAK